MGQDPEVIRAEIERTRAGMTDTVDALGYKADVKSRAKENVQERVDSVKDRISGIAGTVTDTASDAVDSVSGTAGSLSDRAPDGQQLKAQGRQVVSVAQGNPLGLAIGSAALGFIVGMLVPETRKEHELLGETADQVKDQVRSTASEAVDRGKAVAQEAGEAAMGAAQEAGQAAKETAQQSAQEQGQALKQSAQDSAQQVRGS